MSKLLHLHLPPLVYNAWTAVPLDMTNQLSPVSFGDPVAQWLARKIADREVSGSNPASYIESVIGERLAEALSSQISPAPQKLGILLLCLSLHLSLGRATIPILLPSPVSLRVINNGVSAETRSIHKTSLKAYIALVRVDTQKSVRFHEIHVSVNDLQRLGRPNSE